MQPGSCYLGIQLTEYLLIALEFVTHRKSGTCRLEVKFIDYLPTSLEFITHHNPRITWRLSDGFWTTREEPLSLLWLQVEFFRCRWFVKNFQKVGDMAYPLQKICSVYCSQKGKAPTVLDIIVMSGLETSNVERRARLEEKPLEENSRSFVLSSPVYMTAFCLTYWDLGRLCRDKFIDVNNFYFKV
jgi:hypothetical protein